MKLTRYLPCAVIALAAASGCTAEEVPDQLEALSVTASQGTGGAPAWTDLAASGVLSVTGQERDFQLEVASASFQASIHLPGMSDLTLLDGREVSIALSREPAAYGDQITVTIEDAAGPLFFASSVPGSSPAFTWGDTVAESEVDGVIWAYTTIAVHHDGAAASVMPGDVMHATIDGATWRVVPHAAYRVEDDSDYEVDCILPPDVLSVEMLRVDAPSAEERVERAVDLPMLQATSCG